MIQPLNMEEPKMTESGPRGLGKLERGGEGSINPKIFEKEKRSKSLSKKSQNPSGGKKKAVIWQDSGSRASSTPMTVCQEVEELDMQSLNYES